jgi:succinoglycan biosynthesis protein ExoA
METARLTYATGAHFQPKLSSTHPTMESDKNPRVSIVLPCRNEAGYIEECITSILAQDLPEGGFEIVVADGMSTDGTREYLDRMAQSHPEVRVLSNQGRIVSTGLNAAIKAARGDIIVRMDAHTIYASDYVRESLAVMTQTGADNVGGPMQTRADTFMEQAIRAVFHCHWAVGGARSHRARYEGFVDTVIYGCWKKETFDRIGLFDEDLVRNQDDEHNLRLTRSGGKIFQSPRIRSWYRVRGSLTTLFRQYMQYGYWKVLVIRKHTTPASLRHLVPGAFVASLCLTVILGLLWRPGFLATASLILFYGSAAVALAVITAARSRWALLPILPVVIGCFHLGYGYGFLRGLFDFVIFNNAPQTQLCASREEGLRDQLIQNPDRGNLISAMDSKSETERIRRVYREYSHRGFGESKWSTTNKGNILNASEREEKIRCLLQRTGFFPLVSKRVLDVGCGRGELLGTFREWGAQANNLWGVDLIPDRIRVGQRNLSGIRLQIANAESLPFAAGSFDLVVVFTVFSSILKRQMAVNIAAEIKRVLAPQGAVLWYDFRINNPFNKHVRGVSRKTLRRLFPHFQIAVESVSLLPPLVRRLGCLTGVLYRPLRHLPFLRSHLLGLLQNPEDQTQNTTLRGQQTSF